MEEIGLVDLAEEAGAGNPRIAASSRLAALQAPAADDKLSIVRHVVCLAGEVDGDELVYKLGLTGLSWLRAKGLLTYPSPLLGRHAARGAVRRLLGGGAAAGPLPGPVGFARFARVEGLSRAAVVTTGLPCAGTRWVLPLTLNGFVRSVELLAWANAIGCCWDVQRCCVAAPLWADAWRCYNTRESMTALGTG